MDKPHDQRGENEIFEQILREKSMNPAWMYSLLPSFLFIPFAEQTATNNTLAALPQNEELMNGIKDFLLFNWADIRETILEQQYYELDTIVNGGLIVKGRVYIVDTARILTTYDTNSEDGEQDQDSGVDEISIVSVYFEDVTIEKRREGLHLDSLMLTETSEFMIEVHPERGITLIDAYGFLRSQTYELGDQVDFGTIEPQYAEVARRGMEAAIASPEGMSEVEVQLLTENEPIWVSITYRVKSRKPDGSIVMQGLMKDISKQIARRMEIIRNANQLEVALKLMSVVHYIIEFDDHGVPTFTRLETQATAKGDWSGFDTQEVAEIDVDDFVETDINRDPFFKIIHPDDLERAILAFKDLQTGIPVELELRIITPDNDIKYVQNYAIPIFNPDGRVVSAIGGFIDVTQAVEVQAFRSVIDFLTILAHDSKTPLSSIGTASFLLEHRADKIDEAKKAELFKKIHDCALIVSEYMESMLLLARIESGDNVLKMGRTGASEFFTSTLRGAEIYAEGHQYNFNPTIDSNVELETDPVLLRHIVTNLVTNAIKYSPEGSAIEFNLIQEGDEIVFSVRDHGIGIPEADQPYILNSRIRASNSGKAKGSGLGLFTVNKLSQLIGAEISFQSIENEGTTFFVRLPLRLRVES